MNHPAWKGLTNYQNTLYKIYIYRGIQKDYYLAPPKNMFNWLFKLDDSTSLHEKWLFHHFHPLKIGCLEFQVGNVFQDVFEIHRNVWRMMDPMVSFFFQLGGNHQLPGTPRPSNF